MLKFQDPDTEMSLRDGLREYYASRDGLVDGRGVSDAAILPSQPNARRRHELDLWRARGRHRDEHDPGDPGKPCRIPG